MVAAVEQALAKASSRLESLLDDGRWRGFPTLAGRSDVWVSGFVASHVNALEDPGRIDTASVVAALLDSRYPDGGWGYGGSVPADADSTAWCLAAVADRADAEAAADARDVLSDHQVGDGFATYLPDSGIAEFIGAASEAQVRGWTAPHPDVTAAVVLAGIPSPGSDRAEGVLQHLVAQQTGAGFVESYWWRGPFYGTALTLRALDARGRRMEPDQEAQLYRGLARMQLDDGGFGLGSALTSDAFSTALGLEALWRLAHLDDARRRDAAARNLLGSQQDDGGWAGEHVLRIPAPDVVEPRLVDTWSRDTGGGNSLVRDVDGVFATAVAAYSLDLWRREPHDPATSRLVARAATRPLHEVIVQHPTD